MMFDQDAPKDKILAQAKLLYRAAAWVSVMDNKGGDSADLEERAAIRDTVRRFAAEEDYKILIPVFTIMLENHRAWDGWSINFSNFTSELRAAKDDMGLEMRQCLYDLAYSVAIRYRERNWLMAFLVSIKLSLRNFLVPNAQSPELPAYLNISSLEKSALNEIATILDMPQRIID